MAYVNASSGDAAPSHAHGAYVNPACCDPSGDDTFSSAVYVSNKGGWCQKAHR